MAASMAATSMLTVKPSIPIKSSSPVINHFKPKPISLQRLPPKVLSAAVPSSLAAAGAFFSALASADPAIAAHQISEIASAAAASDDNRGLILLLPIVPALAWVLFNILQPALNQLNRMRSSSKGVVIGLGLGGLTAAAQFLHPHAASAASADLAGTTGDDNRALLLLAVVAPALLWVAYNILQPALNQIKRMRSG